MEYQVACRSLLQLRLSMVHFQQQQTRSDEHYQLRREDHGTNGDQRKKWRCYRAVANHIFEVLAHRERRRLGWCFVNYIRTIFPEITNIFAEFRW